MGEYEGKSDRVPIFTVPVIKGSHVKILTEIIELHWGKKSCFFWGDWVNDKVYLSWASKNGY